MENTEKLMQLRHSLAHLLGASILELYPGSKITLGPAVDNGFYYDVDVAGKITDSDLAKIEAKMKDIKKTWTTFEKKVLTKDEALRLFAGNEYKEELINSIAEKGEEITVYTSGNFSDLCRGGHLKNMKDIKDGSFKLERIAGAYWRGDEKNKMLTRIYGLAFETKEELGAYIFQQEEAKKRDHRKLGKELDLFIFSELVGPGLPIYTFKGTIIRQEIINFSNELQRGIGYQEVFTPNINKAELFKVSGHYDKYKDDMFKVSSNYTKEEYYLKPMNCPQHTQVYASKPHSYKDLPIRIADFANLYRDEKPGELSGLTRLRSFCQDDGHCFCRPDQIKEEFEQVLNIIKKALTTYGMDYYIRFSTWDPENPEKYLGDPTTWEMAQTKLKEILIDNKIEYKDGMGEAAIYGPKMDFISRDSLGREWQISTIQLDLIMPERFGLKYIDKDGSEKTPIMIHRAIVGSPERFLGILIEHFAGAFPLWLSPVQVIILPISEHQKEYADSVYKTLKEKDIRVELDNSNESLGKRIRNAKMQKVPYVIVIGDKEKEAKVITVEGRAEKLEGIAVEKFLERLSSEIKNKTLN